MKLFVLLLLSILGTLGQQVFRVTVTNRANEGTFATTLTTPIIATTTTATPWFTENSAAPPALEELAEDAQDPNAFGNAFFAGTGQNYFIPNPVISLRPGQTIQFQVNLNPTDRFHLVTKYLQSNDIFLSFPPTGIPLFDAQGVPFNGDITDQMNLYDAGTEINQAPGLGDNQPDRSGGPSNDTVCSCAENGTVTQIANLDANNFFYDNVDNIISISVTPCTAFQLDIGALTSAIDLGQVVVAVSRARGNSDGVFSTPMADPFFRTNPLIFASSISEGAISLLGTPFESLLRDGDGTQVNALLNTLSGPNMVYTVINNFVLSLSNNNPAGINITVGPFHAAPGDRVHFFVQTINTNDRYYAPNQGGLNIFNGEAPTFGDFTEFVEIWDAGLEVNSAPGTPPRPTGADTPGIPPRLAINDRNPFIDDTPIEGNLVFQVNAFVPPSTTTGSSSASTIIANLSLVVFIFFFFF